MHLRRGSRFFCLVALFFTVKVVTSGAEEAGEVKDTDVGILGNDERLLDANGEDDLLQNGAKVAFPDESTQPLLKETEVEVVAAFPSLIPGKLDLHASSNRLFFTFHPKQGVDLRLKLCEWKPRESRYIPYPNEEYQQTEFRSPLGVRVDNIRGWLLVLGKTKRMIHFDVHMELFLNFESPCRLWEPRRKHTDAVRV